FLDDPVAENDDESAATVNPRLMFAAPKDGFYLFEVRDRLGFNTGTFTLSLDGYAPDGSNVEVGDAPDTTTSAPPFGARVLRGGFVDET
ncbi:hypothetical protein, partial [Salmonella enterica]|uniref:hypothetical protein n=1 Tax=Salmonella enterica TaxID=28901 RepID=UPI0021B22F44